MTNDSLTKFANVLYSEALQEKEKVARELEKEKEDIIKNKDTELKRKFEKEINKYRSQLDYEVKNALSKRENELTKALRQNRQKAADEVFEKVTTKLEEFCKSDKYREYIKNEFDVTAEAFKDGETVCCAAQKDLDMIKEICPIKNVKYEVENSYSIGGFTLKNSDMGIYADCTLRTKLEEQKSLFFKISGLVIE